MEPPVLRTQRLTLSTPVPDDRARVVEYCQDELFRNYLTLPWPYTENDAVFFLESLVPDGWREEREFTWALRETQWSPLLGVVGLRVQAEPRTIDVGYWLGAPHRGSGYTAEAVRRVVAWAFETLPVDAVLCGLSALAEHGLDLRPEGDVAVHVSTGVKHQKRSPEIVNHRLALAADETIVIGRWRVTTAHRTAFDCVRWAPPPKAAGVAEAIARSGLAAIDDLLALAERHPRVHGTRQVRDVAAELGEFAAA